VQAGDEGDSIRAEIINGVPNTTDVAVVELRWAGATICTGTVIAPRVVLTAAHCIDLFAADSVHGPESGDAPILRAVKHPSFDGATFANDIGLVLAGKPFRTDMALLARDDSYARKAVSVEVVGFGCVEQGTNAGVGTRRSGTSSIAARSGTELTLVAGPALPCSGDSGGPLYVGAAPSKVVVGVISRFDTANKAVIARRVDDAVENFIMPFIAETAEGTVSTGQRCYYDEQCSRGTCYEPADAPGVHYCTHGCATDADCEVGNCRGDVNGAPATCVYPDPSPGALGAVCFADADCSSGQCGTPSDTIAKRCTTTCFKDGSLECPAGYECLRNISVNPYGESCFGPSPEAPAEPTSWHCGMSHRAGAPGGGALVFATLAALRKRRVRARR
jgi:hypothetical protein